MKTGKAIKQDPRSAPDKAPANAPDVMSKQMPEYPLDQNELIYPGEGAPFSLKKARNTPATGPQERETPSHPAVPLTEVPRNKTHISAKATKGLLDALTTCARACERCVEACQRANEPHKFATCIAIGRACADICKLQYSYVAAVKPADITILTKKLSSVCASACEACALECGKHPAMQHCMTCETACRTCADQCRSFARQ